MRLASNEVKALLARGQFVSASTETTQLAARTLLTDQSLRANGRVGAAIALSVPKRALKRAVDRNKVKRVMREAFRNHDIRQVDRDILVTFNWAPGSKKRIPLRGTRLGHVTAANAHELFNKLARKMGGR